MFETMPKGNMGVAIVSHLWGFRFKKVSSFEVDKNGTDGYFDGKPVQIKYDEAIANTGNIYHEIWEKTKGKNEQYWRHSPSRAYAYFFVTLNQAIYVPCNELAEAEKGKKLAMISTTSMGFLIKLEELVRFKRCQQLFHDLIIKGH